MTFDLRRMSLGYIEVLKKAAGGRPVERPDWGTTEILERMTITTARS